MDWRLFPTPGTVKLCESPGKAGGLPFHLLVGAGLQLAQGWAAYINETTIFDLATPLSIAGSALLFALLTWRIPKLAGALAAGVTSLGLHDVFGAAGGAVRMAATAVPAGQMAAGAMTIGQAASRAAGGGLQGAMAGVGGAAARSRGRSPPRPCRDSIMPRAG